MDNHRVIALRTLHNSDIQECMCAYCQGIEPTPWHIRRANARRAAARAILAETEMAQEKAQQRIVRPPLTKAPWTERLGLWVRSLRQRWTVTYAAAACFIATRFRN